MSRVAVLKPDHLGDLVLSVPAIRAIVGRYGEAALYVQPGCVGLARFLFADKVDIRTVSFAHLARKGGLTTDLGDLARELDGFDQLLCLRDDPVMRDLAGRLSIPCAIAAGEHRTHETIIQKQALTPVIGDYSRTTLFSAAPIAWPTQLRHVGLCIGAGFPTNRWPVAYWHELGARLARRGAALTLIGGPAEDAELDMLAGLLGVKPAAVLRGGSDFAAFEERLAPLDLVVASDGGTAHICSLTKPICSVFGSSPWRRYAPFGRANRLVTRDEVCSPCVQFSTDRLNGCVTRECTARLLPRQVEAAVLSDGLDLASISGVRVERSVSHRNGD